MSRKSALLSVGFEPDIEGNSVGAVEAETGRELADPIAGVTCGRNLLNCGIDLLRLKVQVFARDLIVSMLRYALPDGYRETGKIEAMWTGMIEPPIRLPAASAVPAIAIHGCQHLFVAGLDNARGLN